MNKLEYTVKRKAIENLTTKKALETALRSITEIEKDYCFLLYSQLLHQYDFKKAKNTLPMFILKEYYRGLESKCNLFVDGDVTLSDFIKETEFVTHILFTVSITQLQNINKVIGEYKFKQPVFIRIELSCIDSYIYRKIPMYTILNEDNIDIGKGSIYWNTSEYLAKEQQESSNIRNTYRSITSLATVYVDLINNRHLLDTGTNYTYYDRLVKQIEDNTDLTKDIVGKVFQKELDNINKAYN